MRFELVAVLLLLAQAPAFPHRLDEYLQATLISLGKDRIDVEITLTPGVAVFPIVAAEMDSNADGAVSEPEQRAYARRILRDLSFTIDGHPLTLHLVSMVFPAIGEMKEGMGAMRIEFQADLPHGGTSRRLVFENRHQPKIGVYLVNCLVPQDPEIRIVAQNRNYTQSLYQLDYAQTGARSEALLSGWWPDDRALLGGLAVLLFARFAFLWRQTRGRGAPPRVANSPWEPSTHGR